MVHVTPLVLKKFAPGRCTERLPFEILSRIFIQCLPSTKFIGPSRRHAPLLLCWVCARWRDIAFATPRLWTSLSLVVLSPRKSERMSVAPVRRPRSLLHLARLWFACSKALPLSLELDVRPNTSMFWNSSWEHHPDLLKLIKLVVSHASRWRRARVSWNLDENLCPFPDIPPQGTPLLEEASLSIARGWQPCHGVREWMEEKLVTSSPRLTHLTWSLPSFLDPKRCPGLLHLSLGEGVSFRLCDIDNLPMLKSLHIILSSYTILGVAKPHTRLRNLVVDVREGNDALAHFLDDLTCPALSSLSITWAKKAGMSSAADQAVLYHFLRRPALLPLESLTLANAAMASNLPTLRMCIQLVSHSLVELSVTGSHHSCGLSLDQDFLQYVLGRPNDFPLLESFTFDLFVENSFESLFSGSCDIAQLRRLDKFPALSEVVLHVYLSDGLGWPWEEEVMLVSELEAVFSPRLQVMISLVC